MLQYHRASARTALADLQEVRAGWFVGDRDLDEGEQAAADGLLDHARFVDGFGLLGVRGTAEQLAWGALLAGDEVQFAEQLELALDEAPGNGHLWLEKARFERARGALPAAEAAYEAAIGADPGLVAPYSSLGMLALERQDLGRALGVLEQGVSHNPESASLWHDLGVAQTVAGRPEEALAAFRRALELAPTRLEVRAKLASLLMASGQPQEGLDVLREGARLGTLGLGRPGAAGRGSDGPGRPARGPGGPGTGRGAGTGACRAAPAPGADRGGPRRCKSRRGSPGTGGSSAGATLS